ncbi:MAG: DUF4177 domain-containing protein [Clostridiales bacterium]|jgi:hypothetical protein|nr:DUF4177 domain-containing protein [Clostridiales bacterium]
MKEFKFVKASEGMKGINLGEGPLLDNINVLVEKYAQEGWEVFQFISYDFERKIDRIVFVRDKQ